MTQLKQHDRTEAALRFMEQQDKLPAISQRRSVRVLKKLALLLVGAAYLLLKVRGLLQNIQEKLLNTLIKEIHLAYVLQ